MWNELQDAGELRTVELSVAFTFNPGKLGKKLLFSTGYHGNGKTNFKTTAFFDSAREFM